MRVRHLIFAMVALLCSWPNTEERAPSAATARADVFDAERIQVSVVRFSTVSVDDSRSRFPSAGLEVVVGGASQDLAQVRAIRLLRPKARPVELNRRPSEAGEVEWRHPPLRSSLQSAMILEFSLHSGVRITMPI